MGKALSAYAFSPYPKCIHLAVQRPNDGLAIMCFQTDGWWGVTNLVCVNNNHHQLFRKSGGSNDFGKSSNVFVTYQMSFNLIGYFF